MTKFFFVTYDSGSGTHYSYVVKANTVENAKTMLIKGNGLTEGERTFVSAKLIEFPVGSNITPVDIVVYGD